MDTSMAFKTWEMSNSMETINSVDEIFKYDRQQQQEILQAKPWQKEWVPSINEIVMAFVSNHLAYGKSYVYWGIWPLQKTSNVHFYASTAKKKYMVSMCNLPLTNFDFIIIQSIALTTSSTLKFQRWPCWKW